jgi:hypothetical protein
MKKLLSLLFASLVVFSLTMPAMASTPTNTATAKTAKAHKVKAHKNHKAPKPTNKVPAKTN